MPVSEPTKPSRIRCLWASTTSSPDMLQYHDSEWGTPQHDRRGLFELLSLEGAQAGLSWATVLAKRPRYRALFANFDADQVARYGEAELAGIMADPGVIRNRGKIQSVITNARAIVALEQKGVSFSQLLWSFARRRQAQGAGRDATTTIPSQSPESAAMAQSLRQRGFRFVGATTCYSLMQAAGLVNDHAADCFRWDEINRSAPAD